MYCSSKVFSKVSAMMYTIIAQDMNLCCSIIVYSNYSVQFSSFSLGLKDTMAALLTALYHSKMPYNGLILSVILCNKKIVYKIALFTIQIEYKSLCLVQSSQLQTIVLNSCLPQCFQLQFDSYRSLDAILRFLCYSIVENERF